MKRLFYFALLAVTFTNQLQACGMVWGKNDSPALMHAEKTLILWDENEKIEHFYRQVHFESSGKNLGFIVPTPNVPEVADASDSLFKDLGHEMERQRPKKYVFFKDQMFSNADDVSGAVGFSGMKGQSRGVQVVAKYDLANYDVQVIKADSLEPLIQWLQTKSFEMRPALKKWLSKYVHSNNYFSVFNFKKGTKENNFETKNVRLSFKSETPYYPYSDSADMPLFQGRQLLLYLISKVPLTPNLDSLREKIPENESLALSWNSKPFFSNQINLPTQLSQFIGKKNLWLSVWQDFTQIRPSVDLEFKKEVSSLSPVLLTPEEIELGPYIILLSLVLIALGAFFILYKLIFAIRKRYFN